MTTRFENGWLTDRAGNRNHYTNGEIDEIDASHARILLRRLNPDTEIWRAIITTLNDEGNPQSLEFNFVYEPIEPFGRRIPARRHHDKPHQPRLP